MFSKRSQATLSVAAAAVALALGASSVMAGDGRYAVDDRYGNGRYDGYDYARVIDVDPIRTRVRVRTPQRECWQETRYDDRGYDDGYGYSYGDSRYAGGRAPQSAGSMILGGIIGAAVGNQIGSGDGRRAATVAGAIIGSAVGHDAAARRDARQSYARGRDDYRGREYAVERCETRYRDDWEERIDGYRVTYEYNGMRQTTRLPYDPGERVRVRVDVRPVR
ncbi:MAG TPA: glycine zipper 2TM domain-containing protein [Steroidobacteraceae bacterium]|nr:glycine zipper 2TM domain-containing protein [Steroidobacteraceae bacterium]HRX89123.1 glycine zipper 2TM domain-containing protein [Steroidobacteraceae bacterium]